MPKVRYGARSLDELRNREIEATKVDTWATTLVGVYESDPDAIRAVLPPFLTPADEPLVRVLVATVDMGGGYPIFGAGSFSVACRHEDVDGDYALVMPMTTEQAVVGGRETFGEPKKLAEIALTRDGDHVSGSFTRMGTTFVEINGRVDEELEPTPGDHPYRLLSQIPAVAEWQGLRWRTGGHPLSQERENAQALEGRRRGDPPRVAIRSGH